MFCGAVRVAPGGRAASAPQTQVLFAGEAATASAGALTRRPGRDRDRCPTVEERKARWDVRELQVFGDGDRAVVVDRRDEGCGQLSAVERRKSVGAIAI